MLSSVPIAALGALIVASLAGYVLALNIMAGNTVAALICMGGVLTIAAVSGMAVAKHEDLLDGDVHHPDPSRNALTGLRRARLVPLPENLADIVAAQVEAIEEDGAVSAAASDDIPDADAEEPVDNVTGEKADGQDDALDADAAATEAGEPSDEAAEDADEDASGVTGDVSEAADGDSEEAEAAASEEKAETAETPEEDAEAVEEDTEETKDPTDEGQPADSDDSEEEHGGDGSTGAEAGDGSPEEPVDAAEDAEAAED